MESSFGNRAMFSLWPLSSVEPSNTEQEQMVVARGGGLLNLRLNSDGKCGH